MLRVPSRQRSTSHLRPPAAVMRVGATAVLGAVAAAALAGCGGSHATATAADPAAAVPASAPLYAGATVRPTGAQKTAALAVGRTLTHQADPYLRLTQLLQTPGSPTLSFSRDVAPWLGPKAGIFLTSLDASGKAQSALVLSLLQGLAGPTAGGFPFGGGGAGAGQGAIVLDVSDAGKARSFLASQARHAGAHAAAYRGVSYQATAAGVAFALVGKFAVIGSEGGLRSVIETTQGGPALAHASGYARLLADAPTEAIAHVYANAAAAGTKESTGLLPLLIGRREANLSLVASKSSVALDADTLAAGPGGGAGGLLAAGADGALALGELPADSWLAFGLGHVGANLGEDVRGLRALASLGSSLQSSGAEGGSSLTLNLKGLLDALLTPLAALGAETPQARQDYTRWMGSGGIFASGGNLLELKGAVVISSSDRAASRAAVAKLAAQLRKGGSVQPVSIAGTDAAVAARVNGLPVMLDIASGVDSGGHAKFVLGLGEASVTAALSPASALAGAPSTAAAASALGEGIHPNLIADVPTLLSLLEGVGLTEDPTLSKVLPYLRSVTTIAGGTRVLGAGVQRARVVLALH